MEPRKIQKHEAQQISKGHFPGANYLIRLRERMVLTGFSPTDPIFILVDKAQEAVQRLCTVIHYTRCDGGVGRQSDRK